MSTVEIPFVPSTAPFSVEQRAWLNGYFTGLLSNAHSGDPASSRSNAPAPKAAPLLLLYGSQTGTAEQLARKLAVEAGRRGFAPEVLEMNACKPANLAAHQHALLVTSTWGDGDPPDNATAFWSFLKSEQAARLEHLAYSVLALGDRNYAEFCGAGKKFDARFEELGARRLHARADCDTDYEATAKAWMDSVWPVLESEKGAGVAGSTSNATPMPASGPTLASARADTGTVRPEWSRNQPFPAKLIASRVLNRPGSAKETRHIEISLEGSGLEYEVGDALGVCPSNCPELVDEILRTLGFDGEEGVSDPQGSVISLRQALLRFYQVTRPQTGFVAAVADRSSSDLLKSLLDPARKEALQEYLAGREVVDLLVEFPAARFSPGEFIGLLGRLAPRLYSISSSPRAHPGQVHLTVAVVRYESRSRKRKGVCSTFLAERLPAGGTVPVFVQTSHGFRLPADSTLPVIMMGPGTGVAPFRAFLEERRAVGATGRNWLLFGDQKKDCDFLYQEELDAMRQAGVLTRLDTAFSRDQAEKVYVQNRLLENATELWSWLEAGAHFYVCGDAKRMAKDVDEALHQVIEKAGQRSREQAIEYVQALKAGKRYQRDVY
jgi:sulfite reductase (NADPH) flavoprotein alpha-component